MTRQTIETMKANATDWSKHELVVIFDGPREDLYGLFKPEINGPLDAGIVISSTKQVGVGGAKNLGASWWGGHHPKLLGNTDKPAKPDDILMFSDNDMHYLPGWDATLEAVMKNSEVTQLGGWKHPFHKPSGRWVARTRPLDANSIEFDQSYLYKYHQVDAVTGNCFVIRWADWLKYGPFDANAIGPGQSEDYALSQRIKAGGGIVATLDPPVAIHVGLANCLGEPATGWEEMSKMAEKQIEEYNIDKIWLSTPDEGTILLEKRGLPSPIHGDKFRHIPEDFVGLNVGSGQRRFDNEYGWINVDTVSRSGQVPDFICDANKLTEKFQANSIDMVVLHHVLEHFGCGEADDVIRQCYEVLKPGGSLLVFVPDMSKLAGRWLGGEISDYTFFVNTYGAYQGEDGDRHKWGYSSGGLATYLQSTLLGIQYSSIKLFDWRDIPGADIARDWWILGVEVVK